MPKTTTQTAWTIERSYQNLYPPKTCVQRIIARHIAASTEEAETAALHEEGRQHAASDNPQNRSLSSIKP